MPAFRFRALDSSGKSIAGVLDGPDEAAVVQRVQRMGHMPIAVVPAQRSGGLLELLNADLTGRRGLPAQDLAYLTREIATLLKAGQNLDQALRFLVETETSARVRELLTDLREKVRGGSALAASLAEYPQTFSRLYIGLVRAGEATGTLDDALGHLADLLERQRKLAATVRSALIYPAMLTVATILSIVLLLTFVLPQFTPIFKDAGAALPAPTRFVMALGDTVREDGLWMLAGLCAAAVALHQAYRQPSYRRLIDGWILRAPLCGALVRQAEAARFTRTLGTLLDNGVGLLPALEITRGVMNNSVFAAAVEAAAARVKEGGELVEPFAAYKVLPAKALHLLQLGVQTGRLGEMSLHVAGILEDQIRVSVQTLVSMIVPVVTIVMGVGVAGIIASLLLAMLSLNDLAF
jgi:general secretion pathway protein F